MTIKCVDICSDSIGCSFFGCGKRRKGTYLRDEYGELKYYDDAREAYIASENRKLMEEQMTKQKAIDKLASMVGSDKQWLIEALESLGLLTFEKEENKSARTILNTLVGNTHTEQIYYYLYKAGYQIVRNKS